MKITTGLVRLSYAHLLAPAAMMGSDVEKYSASFIIPKSDKKGVTIIENAIEAMKNDKDAIAKWGGKNTGIRIPLRDGDTDRPEDAAYADSYFLNANANVDHKPRVLNRDMVEIADPDEIYSGCWVQAVLSIFPYNSNGNKGIGVGLLGVRKIKDGDSQGGTVVSDSDFDDSLLGDAEDLL
ncbi:MAG: DUF2815 family protein [Selenomonas sp.]|nr:DUF2815 family protein [Selenomonas sp.]